MRPIIITREEVQKLLRIGRTKAYRVISDIREDYPTSGKLIGAKVKTLDFSVEFEMDLEEIYKVLNEP